MYYDRRNYSLLMSSHVAIVTGGNKGIGLGITKALVENNYNVIVCGKSDLKWENDLNKIRFVKGDLREYETHVKLVNTAIDLYGKLDLYVNNVGISEWKPIDKVDINFLDKLIKTNLYSSFWGCKASEKHLKPNGSIINISSIAGKRGSKNNSVYVSTKFALNGLTQSLAKELGHRNIRVNALCPVLIKTEGLIKALKDEYAPGHEDVEIFLEGFRETQTAMNRLPSIDEVAQMVVFLASEKASAITGQCINVDCGVLPQ